MRWQLDETALDLFARRPARGFLTGLACIDAPVRTSDTDDAHAGGYVPRQVVELAGGPGSPAPVLLLHAMAAFLARDVIEPQDATDDDPARVILFDHECFVTPSALAHVISSKLLAAIPNDTERRKQTQLLLQRVKVFRCRDTLEWVATLNHSHFELLDAPPAPLLVAINTIGSFSAVDRMMAKSVGNGLALIDQPFLTLQQFIQQHTPIVFAEEG
ncbi:TPA: hypothetical protein N0F65_001553 [Lagenidium giganteum]|uniref:Uncharacterized protein n=1 Tax=Lagenidium giganteum TaxID=4803 RepID=A0AAV2YJ92_9STRA|nr:TPA: hypothetical protein N0F65_001553 [Lagenidium giganteum]